MLQHSWDSLCAFAFRPRLGVRVLVQGSTLRAGVMLSRCAVYLSRLDIGERRSHSGSRATCRLFLYSFPPVSAYPPYC